MDNGPLASTMIDVFDSSTRMRQGALNLYLWPSKEADMSPTCTTPGLFYSKPVDPNNFDPQDPEP